MLQKKLHRIHYGPRLLVNLYVHEIAFSLEPKGRQSKRLWNEVNGDRCQFSVNINHG